jgi:hypothetical protein
LGDGSAIRGVEFVFGDIEELPMSQEVVDGIEGSLCFGRLELDRHKCRPERSAISEIDEMPLGQLVLVGDRLVQVGFAIPCIIRK